jgi:hypothetical protein
VQVRQRDYDRVRLVVPGAGVDHDYLHAPNHEAGSAVSPAAALISPRT